MAEISTSTWNETAASNTASPPDGAPEGMAPSGTNDWMRETQAVLKREWNRSHPTVSSATSTTAFTLTYTTAPTAYAQGLMFAFKVHAASTGSVTLNVNALGAKKVYRNISGTATQVASGEWQTNDIVLVSYDTTLDSAAGGFWWVNAPATGITPSFVSTDAGAAEGPTLDLYRDSASPAASDVLGAIQFNGRDSAANKQIYARIKATITDPTSTSEDSTLVASTVVAGSETTILTLTAGAQIGAPTGGDKGAGTINLAANAAATALQQNGAPAGRVLLQTLTASTSASLLFTGANNTLYAGYECILHRVQPATNAVAFWLRASTDQGASLISTSTYVYGYVVGGSGAVAGAAGSGGDTKIVFYSAVGTAGQGISGRVQINLGTAANDFQATWTIGEFDTANYNAVCGYGMQTSSSVNGFGFLMSSGNIASGTIYVYGIPKV